MSVYVDSKVEILFQDNSDSEGFKKHIERVGRTCYKSADKITDTSYERFVNNMVKSKHGAMLEHGTIYLEFPYKGNELKYEGYRLNKYSKAVVEGGTVYVTTNYRVIVENNWTDDMEFWCLPTPLHERRVTVRFNMDRIGSQSVCRHRVMSFAQESTRYVNYFKEKFGSVVKISRPVWISPDDINDETISKVRELLPEIFRKKSLWEKIKDVFKKSPFENLTPVEKWLLCNEVAEWGYMSLIKDGWTAQMARSILPCDLATEIIVTGFTSDWIHFLNLRSLGTTGAPHPDIKDMADDLKSQMINYGFITEKSLGKE